MAWNRSMWSDGDQKILGDGNRFRSEAINNKEANISLLEIPSNENAGGFLNRLKEIIKNLVERLKENEAPGTSYKRTKETESLENYNGRKETKIVIDDAGADIRKKNSEIEEIAYDERPMRKKNDSLKVSTSMKKPSVVKTSKLDNTSREGNELLESI